MNKIMEERRGALFFIFLHTNEKRPTTKDQTTQKSGLICDLMISFFILTRTLTKHKAEEEEDEEEEEEEDEERETTALFIRISFCLIFLNRYHRLSVVFYDSVKARTFFSSVAPKVTYSFVPFLETRHKKFNDNKNNNHYNNKR